MLSTQEANDIVVNCIKAVSGVASVNTAKSLDDARIKDSTRINNLLTLIVHDSKIGVPSKNHTINSGWLNNVSPGTIVNSLIDIVEEKSFRVTAKFKKEFIAIVRRYEKEHLSKQKIAKANKNLKEKS